MNNPFEVIDSRLSNIESLLLDIKHKPEQVKTDTQENDLLTVPELAEVLTLSIPTIYAMTSTNRIPFFKRGKKVYFSRIEIDAWVKSGRRKTVDEIAAEVNAAPGVSKPAPRPRPLIQAPRPKVFVENPDEGTPSRSITNLFGIKDNK